MSDTISPSPAKGPEHNYSWRFWIIILTLSVTMLLSALDIGVVATALPSIVADLGAGPEYVWVANAYFLTMTAFQPLYGQAANIVGRRILTILAVVLFAVGSAISGSAKTTAALIGGRAVQGLGGGGLNVMVEIVVCDLVPLRERPKFIGVIFISFAFAIAVGPLIGGLFTERVTWRWIFYLNLPIAGVALVLLYVFLHVQYKKDTARNYLKRIDFGGNTLLVAAVVSVLLALTWGGTTHPWSAWQTLLPLILGIVGLIAFVGLQTTNYIPEPTMPVRMFSNRSSLAGFGLAFVHSMITYWISYYLPLYFQGVLGATPILSGVYLLPTAIAAMPCGIAAGMLLSKFGRYRPIHFFGVICLIVSFGLFSMLDSKSSTGFWLGIQFLEAAGVGVLLPTTLPAIQAPLQEKDTAVVTSTWGFLRSFGGVWGIAIPSAVFNSRVNQLLHRVDNIDLQNQLRNGGAYQKASKAFLAALDDTPVIKKQVLSVYVDSLRLAWQVGIGFCCLAFVIALLIREIPMRESLETEFGLALAEKPGAKSEGIVDIEDEAQRRSSTMLVRE